MKESRRLRARSRRFGEARAPIPDTVPRAIHSDRTVFLSDEPKSLPIRATAHDALGERGVIRAWGDRRERAASACGRGHSFHEGSLVRRAPGGPDVPGYNPTRSSGRHAACTLRRRDQNKGSLQCGTPPVTTRNISDRAGASWRRRGTTGRGHCRGDGRSRPGPAKPNQPRYYTW